MNTTVSARIAAVIGFGAGAILRVLAHAAPVACLVVAISVFVTYVLCDHIRNTTL